MYREKENVVFKTCCSYVRSVFVLYIYRDTLKEIYRQFSFRSSLTKQMMSTETNSKRNFQSIKKRNVLCFI